MFRLLILGALSFLLVLTAAVTVAGNDEPITIAIDDDDDDGDDGKANAVAHSLTAAPRRHTLDLACSPIDPSTLLTSDAHALRAPPRA